MADIFGSKVGGVQSWKVGRGIITIPDMPEGLLLSRAEFTYTRTQSELSPINVSDRIILTGEGSGTFQFGLIIGPSGGLKAFVKKYSDVCNISGNTLSVTPGGNLEPCKGGFKMETFKLTGVLIDTFNITATAAESGGLAFAQGTVSGSFLTMG